MTPSTLTRFAALSACLALTSALAQIGPAYVGSTTPFLSSAFCTKAAICIPAGNIKLASGITRSFFTVKLRRPQKYGPPSYTIYLDRLQNKQKVRSASLMYPPSQDYSEDGTFFKTFVSFMTGYDVNRAYKDVFQCDLRISGQETDFSVSTGNLNAGYAVEGIVTVNDMGDGEGQTLKGKSATTKIVIADACE